MSAFTETFKGIKWFIGFVILAVTLGGFILSAAEERTKYISEIDNHEHRIEKLENNTSVNHDLLLEIRINLKNDIILHGGKYIENPQILEKVK